MSEPTNKTLPENLPPKPKRELIPITPEEIEEKLANHAKWLEKVRECGFEHGSLEDFPDDLKNDPLQADFSFCDFPDRYDLSKRNLRFVDFTSASLFQVKFSSAFLYHVTFTSTNLIGADFTSANILAANFTSAYLRSANLTSADCFGTDFTSIDLSNATLTSSKLIFSKFGRSPLMDDQGNGVKNERKELQCSVADLHHTKLSGAELVFVEFDGTNLSEADFSNAKLEKAVLKECDITRANFTRADLTNADLETVKWIETADFSETNLKGAKLPPNTDFLSAVDVFAESSKQNKRLVWLVGLACAALLAIGLISRNGGEIKLTMMGVSVSTEWYLFFTPIIASLWFVYTQFNLLTHWELVAGLPSILQNGLPVFHRLHPWFPNQLISLFFAHFPNKVSVRKVVQYLIIGAMLWLVPIGSLLVYPWLIKNELFPYDKVFSLNIVNLCVVAAGVVGVLLFGRTYTILKGLTDPVWGRVDKLIERIATNKNIRKVVSLIIKWIFVIFAVYEVYVISHWLTYYQLK